MKIGKNIKVIIIILLSLIIIFALLGNFNLLKFKEGLEEDVPKCSSSEIVPEDTENSLFLKTSAFPPVCPSCPYYNPYNLKDHNHNHDDSSYNGYYSYNSGSGSGSGNNSNNETKNSNNNNDTTTNANNNSKNTQTVTQQSQTNNIKTDNSDSSITDNSNKTNTDNSVTSTNINQDSSVKTDNSTNQTQTSESDSNFNNLLGNNSIMLGSFGGSDIGSSLSSLLPVSTPANVTGSSLTPYDNIKTTDPETISMINDLKATVTKLNQQLKTTNKEECPACPACERCPEPAFECKKVPNYRSPSIDNYMPVPILNDFSKF